MECIPAHILSSQMRLRHSEGISTCVSLKPAGMRMNGTGCCGFTGPEPSTTLDKILTNSGCRTELSYFRSIELAIDIFRNFRNRVAGKRGDRTIDQPKWIGFDKFRRFCRSSLEIHENPCPAPFMIIVNPVRRPVLAVQVW